MRRVRQKTHEQESSPTEVKKGDTSQGKERERTSDKDGPAVQVAQESRGTQVTAEKSTQETGIRGENETNGSRTSIEQDRKSTLVTERNEHSQEWDGAADVQEENNAPQVAAEEATAKAESNEVATERKEQEDTAEMYAQIMTVMNEKKGVQGNAVQEKKMSQERDISDVQTARDVESDTRVSGDKISIFLPGFKFHKYFSLSLWSLEHVGHE